MEIPNELLLEVLQHLEKSELKSARLVSRRWSCCAAEHLFTKLYISPHQLNIEVFQAVCQHPLLSRCVKELEYDAVYFVPDLSFEEYFRSLWNQFMEMHQWVKQAPNLSLASPDEEVIKFFTITSTMRDTNIDEYHKVEEMCKEFAFVKEGHRVYQLQALDQESHCMGTWFSKLLEEGLEKLYRLNSMHIDSDWFLYCGADPTQPLRARQDGSPHARSWKPFYLSPHGATNGPPALLEAFKNFQTNLSMRSMFSNERQSATHMPQSPGGRRYFKIKSFKFNGAQEVNPFYVENRQQQDKILLVELGNALEFMLDLEHLELDLTYRWPEVLAQVFNKTVKWAHLTTFNFSFAIIGVKGLIELMMVKMPRLRCLHLWNIILIDGRWASVIEFMRVANFLLQFDGCWDGMDDTYRDRKAVIDYVLDWPKNPSMEHPRLKSHQSPSQSLEYLTEVFRLCGVYDDPDSELAKIMVDRKERYLRERADLIQHAQDSNETAKIGAATDPNQQPD